MSMQKIMIIPACLGILLLGIVITPSVFAADGCGTGTVLVDGVCQLAPVESSGCGQGTVLVDGVCMLDKTAPIQGSSFSFGILHVIVIIGVVIAGGVIALIFAVRRGSSGTASAKPAKQDLKEYESKYLAKQDVESSPKPAETKPTSSSCNSCGKPLTPTAKFCGKCGSTQ